MTRTCTFLTGFFALAFLPGCLDCLAMADCIGMHSIQVVDESGNPVLNFEATLVDETGEERTFSCPDEEEYSCGPEGTIELYRNGELSVSRDEGSVATLSIQAGKAETCGCPKMVDEVVTLP